MIDNLNCRECDVLLLVVHRDIEVDDDGYYNVSEYIECQCAAYIVKFRIVIASSRVVAVSHGEGESRILPVWEEGRSVEPDIDDIPF